MDKLNDFLDSQNYLYDNPNAVAKVNIITPIIEAAKRSMTDPNKVEQLRLFAECSKTASENDIKSVIALEQQIKVNDEKITSRQKIA